MMSALMITTLQVPTECPIPRHKVDVRRLGIKKRILYLHRLTNSSETSIPLSHTWRGPDSLMDLVLPLRRIGTIKC
jgi:hypothetical protein